MYTQKKRYDCGPIAILNALKWADNRYTKSGEYEAISHHCKSQWPSGTFRHHLYDCMCRYRHILNFKDGWLCPDKKALREALRSGQWGAIVNSVHKTGKDEWMGHYSFLYWDEGLKAANLYSNEAITDIDHVELKDMMTYQVFDFDGVITKYPLVWMVERI